MGNPQGPLRRPRPFKIKNSLPHNPLHLYLIDGLLIMRAACSPVVKSHFVVMPMINYGRASRLITTQYNFLPSALSGSFFFHSTLFNSAHAGRKKGRDRCACFIYGRGLFPGHFKRGERPLRNFSLTDCLKKILDFRLH